MKRPERHVVVGTIIIVLVSLFFIWIIEKYIESQKVATIGDTAPNIQTSTVSLQSFQLNSLRGEPVFVNFFTPWCQSCIEETPDIISFVKEYGNWIHVVMIDRGDSRNMVQDYIRQYHLPSNITVLLDQDNHWSQPLGVTGQPETFFITANGKITQHLLGPLTGAQMVTYAKQAGMHTK